ncbi:MAG TPA: DinB family protein [Bryobacteraceae bacterium]|jgi:hypothetical protein|nr:DinB family protein [Bryobacteraceae bacterium]
MPTNPYASHLGSADPVEVIRATPVQLEKLIQSIGPEKLNVSPAPGKWSVRDIISHLADCEIVFAFRLRQTLAEEHPVIQPFDQDRWAAPYPHYDARTALAAFSALRQWNVALIAGLKPEDFERTMNHPERGDMTFRTVVETMGGHDRNHLPQIEAVLK